MFNSQQFTVFSCAIHCLLLANTIPHCSLYDRWPHVSQTRHKIQQITEFRNVWSSVGVSPVSANSEPQKLQTSHEHSQQKSRQNFFKYSLKWNCLKILLSGQIYP